MVPQTNSKYGTTFGPSTELLSLLLSSFEILSKLADFIVGSSLS
uniref:Protein AIG1 n=1 Tax=Rhizophora mucronata TaxID=61149 RepID=A0A2P2QXA2_RHIMU